MDLISHFGLYYLYENNFKMRRNKPLEENSDYKSYIEDLPSIFFFLYIYKYTYINII